MNLAFTDSTSTYNNNIVRAVTGYKNFGIPKQKLEHSNIFPNSIKGKIWRFNGDIPLSSLKHHYLFQYITKLAENIPLTDAEKHTLEDECNRHNNKYPARGGWKFDFSDFMRVFWVKTEYGGIKEVWAFSKGGARRLCSGASGKIIKIVEVK